MRFNRLVNADSWKSALRELGLIVAGVLIAMWASSLHDTHEKRVREKVVLRQLLQATRENEVRARQAAFEDSVVWQNSMKAIGMLHPKMPGDSLARVVSSVMWISDYHPLTGVYEALAQSGDLTLIRNDSLRFAISKYTGEVAGVMPLLRTAEARGLELFMELTRIQSSGRVSGDDPRVAAVLSQFRMLTVVRVQQIQDWLRNPAITLRRSLEKELGETGWSPPPLRKGKTPL
ncbi:MAG TPA: hypothetical protein VM100_03005 [Longimicrobiales bacterium]|nr:hypothetical protein [Longimicrobiales bacterium]